MYSYADAVKLLGAKENRILAALDRILGGALLSGATMGLSDLLGWFDAKADFMRLSHELLVRAAERRSGLSRHSQTERAHAAHAVIVIVAFFDAVDELTLPITHDDLDLNQARQHNIFALRSLFDGDLPLPSPSQPYERILLHVSVRYTEAAGEYMALVQSSAVWDRMNETERARLDHELQLLTQHAVLRYEELLRGLGADYPELRFWFQVQDGVATRVALGELERSLTGLLVGRSPDARRAELARKYRALLERPLVDEDDLLPGLRVPRMGRAYIDPDFQVIPYDAGVQPSMLAWWQSRPVRHDLYRYLTGYLTSPQAVRTPLLVLGDPGSGKSMLTKVLAARLPPSDFLTVRVELRGTPAEGDLVDQIQHGLRAALQEDISWAELARSSGDALPIVLLDGFDELLQATGVNQTRYLAKVEQFQRDRAETGHPVAVVVTSRMSVCGGIHIPYGSDVLRLAPFTERHVQQWLDSWNDANEAYFTQTRLAPLTTEVAMRYPDLATQPLLLLMLAIYDAAENALQQSQDRIGEAGLYERLLSMFARREVSKDDEDRTDANLAEDTETELERLSVVAFAMFNRGTQWVTEADLSADLAALLDEPATDRRPGMRSPLSAGEAVLGRFFFVQRAEAVRDEHTLRTYEFLHATFGEYLVARFTLRVLTDLLAHDRTRPRRHAGAPLDDTELFALLSFSPLSVRLPILRFLQELTMEVEDRSALADLLRRLFDEFQSGAPRPHSGYEPVRRGIPTRYAVYGVNLVALGTVLTGPADENWFGVERWSRLTAFWKSQLTTGEWLAVRQSLNVRWRAEGRIALRFGLGDLVAPADLSLLPAPVDPMDIARDAHFTADPQLNFLRYPLEPILATGAPISSAKMMIDLWFAPVDNRPARDAWYWAAADFAPNVVIDQVRIDSTVRPETLRGLADTWLGLRPAFWAQLYDRIGKNGPDEALLAIVDDFWPRLRGVMLRPLIPMMDAWLRLREVDHRFPDDRRYPDLDELLRFLDLDAARAVRPDFATRIETLGFVVPDEQPDIAVDATSLSLRPTEYHLLNTVWGDKLTELDGMGMNGMISADEYLARHERVLYLAALAEERNKARTLSM